MDQGSGELREEGAGEAKLALRPRPVLFWPMKILVRSVAVLLLIGSDLTLGIAQGWLPASGMKRWRIHGHLAFKTIFNKRQTTIKP